MTKEEIDCEEFPEHEECQCSGDPDDGDALYDAWADDRVIAFYEALEERHELYKKLLSADHSTNNIKERDELEKELVYNLTGKRGLWLNMNNLHEWVQE
jgi:hypothetical protein